MLTKPEMLKLIPDTRPSQTLYKMKPTQVRDFPKWCKAHKQYLVDTGNDYATIVCAVKADGHSVMFECHGGTTYRVYSRTDKPKLLFSGTDAGRFVTQLACDLHVRLACELRALYDGQEMGFLEVLSMLRIFRENGMLNVGRFQLQLCPFGVHSVNPSDTLMTERAGSFLPHGTMDKLLAGMVEPGNPLVQPVERGVYHARLYDIAGGEYELEFLTQDHRQTVARSPQAFFDYLIAQADARRIEGFVLKGEPKAFKKQPVVINQYGVRDQSAVKVKREFKVTLLACRILDKTKGKVQKSLIFTYGLNEQGDIVYAGEQTGHERLNTLLPAGSHAFSFKTKDQKKALFTLSREQVQRRIQFFVETTSSCSNLSKNMFCPIGLKLHDMTSKPVDLSKLSVLKTVAEANPHFVSTREASNRFAVAIQRGEKKRPPQYRKRKTLGGSPTLQPKRPRTDAPIESLSFDDFMDQLGEQFRPPPRVERRPSPVVTPAQEKKPEPEKAPETTVVIPVQEKAPETTVVIPVQEKAPETTTTKVNTPHTALFISPLPPVQTKLFKKQFEQLGWTLASTPGPDVTLIVAANQSAIDRMPMCLYTERKEQCPNAEFITREALKAMLPGVAI